METIRALGKQECGNLVIPRRDRELWAPLDFLGRAGYGLGFGSSSGPASDWVWPFRFFLNLAIGIDGAPQY